MLFKDEWLNEQFKKGDIIPTNMIGVVNLRTTCVNMDIKTWRSKVRTKFKKEGYIYIYQYDSYANQKVGYEWSIKKWTTLRRKWEEAIGDKLAKIESCYLIMNPNKYAQ